MKKLLQPVLLTAFFILIAEYSSGISLSFSVTPSSCGAADGEIHVNVNGGAGPYTYLWSTGADKSHLHDLLPGTYTVTVTDHNGLTAIDSAEVISSNDLHISIDDHAATGMNADGSFDIEIDGGLAPFTINSVCPGWTPSLTTSLLNDFQLTGLFGYSPDFNPSMGCMPKSSGIEYEFEINDAGGCHVHVRKTIHAKGFFRSPSTSGSCGVMGTGIIHDTLNFSNSSFTFLSCEASISVTDFAGNPVDSIRLTHNGPGPMQNTVAYEFDSIAAGSYILHYYLEDLDAPGHPISTTAWTADTVTVSNLGLSCGNVIGVVYFDANGNCLQDASEPGLKNSVVEIQPGNHFTLTDSTGFYAYALPLGNYTIQHAPPLNAALTVNCPSAQPFAFSVLSPQQQVTINFADSSLGKDLAVDVFLTSLTPGHSANIIATVMNVSATASYNDTLIVKFDTLLEINGTVPAAFELTADAAKFVIDSLLPFSSMTFILQAGLAADNSLADTILITSAELLSDGDYALLNNSDTIESTVAALLSPNQVTVCPKGYGSKNYLPLTEKQLRYLVEFQNVSGDTVNTIVLKQDISEGLDLSSFIPVAASHPYAISFNGREIQLTFQGLNLPDSSGNENASRGYIAFRLLQSDLAKAGDRIDAVAEINFDSDPTIITDTCRLTLYDCDSLFTSLPVSILACENSTISFGVTTALECGLQWWYDGVIISTSANITIPSIAAGQHQVIAEAITPYCNNTQQYIVNAASLPDAIFTVDHDTLTADLTGVSYQWFLEGIAIPGATDPVYVAVASGNYTVQVTSFIGCVNISSATFVSITSLGDLAANGIAMYPNPGSHELNLILPVALAEKAEIYLIAIDGRIVKTIATENEQTFLISTSELSSGIYQLVVVGNSEKYSARWVKM